MAEPQPGRPVEEFAGRTITGVLVAGRTLQMVGGRRERRPGLGTTAVGGERLAEQQVRPA